MKQLNIIILTISFFAISCNIKGNEKNYRSTGLKQKISTKENFENYDKYKKWTMKNTFNPLTWYNGAKETLASIELACSNKTYFQDSLNETIESYDTSKTEEIDEAMDNLSKAALEAGGAIKEAAITTAKKVKNAAEITGKGIIKYGPTLGKAIYEEGSKAISSAAKKVKKLKRSDFNEFSKNAIQLTSNLFPNLLLSSVTSTLLFSYPENKNFTNVIMVALLAKDIFDWSYYKEVEKSFLMKGLGLFKQIEDTIN